MPVATGKRPLALRLERKPKLCLILPVNNAQNANRFFLPLLISFRKIIDILTDFKAIAVYAFKTILENGEKSTLKRRERRLDSGIKPTAKRKALTVRAGILNTLKVARLLRSDTMKNILILAI